jgi:hypothetical protein
MRLGKARVERMRPVRVNKLGKGVRTRDQGVKGERVRVRVRVRVCQSDIVQRLTLMMMRAHDAIKDILDKLITIVALQLFPSTITEECSVFIG